MTNSRRALNTFKQNLNASVGKDTGIITVSFDSSYPREAQLILRSVIDSYKGFYEKEKLARLAELERWRSANSSALEKKQKEMLAFKQANSVLSFTGEKGNIVLQKLASLQDAVTTAHIESVNAKAALDTTKTLLGTPEGIRKLVEYIRSTGAAPTNDPNEQSLRSQLLAMEQQREALTGRYMADHPAVRAAEATIASLRSRIGELDRGLAESQVLTLEQKVSAAKNRESELTASYDEQKKAAMELNTKAAEFDLLEQEVKRLVASLEKADSQMVELKAAQNTGVPTITEFDEPNLPTAPVSPIRSMIAFSRFDCWLDARLLCQR